MLPWFCWGDGGDLVAKIAVEWDAASNLGSGGPPRKYGGGWTLGMHGRLRGLNMKWHILGTVRL